MIVALHDLSLAARFCHRIVLMHAGRVVASGRPPDVLTPEHLAAVYRIDAKLARFTTSSISKGLLKLRYRDEDGDFVAIEGDDDIQIAFMEWREGVRNMYSGGVGEIELFCVGGTS